MTRYISLFKMGYDIRYAVNPKGNFGMEPSCETFQDVSEATKYIIGEIGPKRKAELKLDIHCRENHVRELEKALAKTKITLA